MTVYVAARAKHRKNDVAQILKTLRKMDYKLAYDWPAEDSGIKKPYRDPKNRKHNLAAQTKMLQTAAKADIFILLDDPGLRGAYMEFGAFLHDCIQNPKGRKAFVVGPDSHERESVFESPSYVYYVDTIEEVFKILEVW